MERLAKVATEKRNAALGIGPGQKALKEEKRVPKVKTNIATIKKLTKAHASKSGGALEWLSYFLRQIEL